MRTESEHSVLGAQGHWFATTSWSVVLAAGSDNSAEAVAALEVLCRAYWYPIYAYVRRRGYSAEDSEDLTQAFFAHLLRKEVFNHVAPDKGRFRSFLLVCLKHFLIDQWEKTNTRKHGVNSPPRVLDLQEAEGRYKLEPTVELNPETLYERRWALDLLQRVLVRLQAELGTSGKDAIFHQLKECIFGDGPEESNVELATRLGMSHAAFRVTVHRVRQRFREMLRSEIAQTVGNPGEIDAEIHYLYEVVSR